ncbi:hypothetical protein CYK72_15920 [Clostridium perfringens]|nr:hypothetical protein CYK72_15920 [Clostridium perfringens]
MNEIKINDRFVKIPNCMVQTSEDESLVRKYKDMILLVWICLKKRENRDICYFSIANLVKGCGYSVKENGNSSSKMNGKIKKLLQQMIEDKVIVSMSRTIDKNLELNNLIECVLMETEKNFFILEDYQYDWIMEYKGKEKNINLLKLFCAIKSRISTRYKDEGIQDGYYEVSFPSYKKLVEDTGISESNIKRYLDILVNLNLIRYANAGTLYNPTTGEIKECNNTYAIYKSGWEDELEGSIRLFKQKKKEEGWIFTKKKQDKNTNSLRGKKGSLTKKINNKTVTEEEIEEYNQIKIELEKRRQNKSKQKALSK